MLLSNARGASNKHLKTGIGRTKAGSNRASSGSAALHGDEGHGRLPADACKNLHIRSDHVTAAHDGGLTLGILSGQIVDISAAGRTHKHPMSQPSRHWVSHAAELAPLVPQQSTNGATALPGEHCEHGTPEKAVSANAATANNTAKNRPQQIDVTFNGKDDAQNCASFMQRQPASSPDQPATTACLCDQPIATYQSVPPIPVRALCARAPTLLPALSALQCALGRDIVWDRNVLIQAAQEYADKECAEKPQQ